MASNIYTRTGDKGTTGLVDGSRVPKDAARVEAYGAVDEANSWVGLAASRCDDPALGEILTFLQHRLYNCSSNLATPPGSPYPRPTVAAEDIAALEAAIDRFEARTGAIRSFVLPGGTGTSATLHVARTVVRRAERRMVALSRHEAIDPLVLKLVNRASDLLFAAARYANAVAGQPDLAWDKDRPRP